MGFDGILAWPVFPWCPRYNDATHEALFSSSGYQKQWPHQDISPVQGVVPIFQQFTSNVLADSNKMALAGHDFGPLAPHLCTPPDNTLIALTMTLSSCKWPAIAH